MSLNDRFFFHTFPRPEQRESAEATLDRALDILSFMKEAGLVLAPEIVNWELPLEGGGACRSSNDEHASRSCRLENWIVTLPPLDRSLFLSTSTG
jgi:hypothetical protein